jgi:hypothetical protein
MCSSAYHTYQETERVISPSGRTATCSFNVGRSASLAFNQQCQATLVVGTDYGDYIAEDSPDVTCSLMGNVVNTTMDILVHLGKTDTKTRNWPCNGPACLQQPACTGDTVASCPLLTYVNSGGPCYQYVLTSWLVVNGECIGILGPNNDFIIPATGPGACQ